MAEEHTTLRAIAGELAARGIRIRRDGGWHVSDVRIRPDRLKRLHASA